MKKNSSLIPRVAALAFGVGVLLSFFLPLAAMIVLLSLVIVLASVLYLLRL